MNEPEYDETAPKSKPEIRGGDKPEDYWPEWEEDTQSWKMTKKTDEGDK